MKINEFGLQQIVSVITVITVAIFIVVAAILMFIDIHKLEINKVNGESNVIKISGSYKIVDITVNDKTHQYLEHVSNHAVGLCHYPECKYCKKEIQK